ncbi:hypothetical protein [Aeromicrobium massiliense]|uniref:hypothetical protein n=1 Tax=Aeromicrobium massiliense TaxID=1464554 RepID=UPI0005785105|nr:hypothetical protein [Aeromicrobium massiliense]
MTTNVSLIDFRVHFLRTGSDEGGRVDFQRMLSALIGQVHPSATEIRPAPGDWGIDILVGSLVDKVSIWQSKYFYTDIGDSQKAQIRDSFASAMKNAAKEGYTVETWVLCVACELSAPERKWWDGKKRGWERDNPGLNIELWDAPVLRRKLLAPESAGVAQAFYPGYGPPPSSSVSTMTVPPVAPAAEAPRYESALFVRQLTTAGIYELDGQRAAYFNADLVVRDVEARAVPAELAAVEEIDQTLVGLWEDSVADPESSPTVENYENSARKLYSTVMSKTLDHAPPTTLPVGKVHLRGFMHRVVEDSRAGWVHDWRDVARQHAEEQTKAEQTTAAVDEARESEASVSVVTEPPPLSPDEEGEGV